MPDDNILRANESYEKASVEKEISYTERPPDPPPAEPQDQ
jgi:hypothetical protein